MSWQTYEQLRAVLLILASFAGIYVLASISARPFRWLSQARHFLSVLDMARLRGTPPEEVLLKLADMGSTDIGMRLHLLACWLRRDWKLHQALPRMRRFLPPSVEALLIYGYSSGRLETVLPLGQKEMQELVESPHDQRHDLFTMVSMALGVFFVSLILMAFVVPKFIAIMVDMGADVPWPLILAHSYKTEFFLFQLGMIGLIVVTYRMVMSGPAARIWMECKWPWMAYPIQGWFRFQVMRYQQRFGRVLAKLLDVGVPEEEALIVAGKATGHPGYQAQVAKALAELRAGTGLRLALRNVDLDDDFHFRLNAARESDLPLSEALKDWFESARARARLREQVLVNLTSAFFVLYNAVLIGAIGGSFFHVEAQLINALTMW